MSAQPFISVIIPVYNGEESIGECIQSFLDQDYPKNKMEIIVVDNNSSDNTKIKVMNYPVQYILEDKKQSSYAARNTGAKKAQGEALLFFDADQKVKLHFLSKITKDWNDVRYDAFGAQFQAHGESKTVAGKYWSKAESIKFVGTDECEGYPKLRGGNILIRRSSFDKIQGFNDSLISWGDYDFSYRFHKAGLKVKSIDDAYISHKERSTVSSLLRRDYRIGFGRSEFDRLHRELKESVIYVLLKALKRTIIGTCALIWGCIKPLQGITRKDHLGIISLDIAMRWAYFWGRLHGAFNFSNKRPPADW